MSFPKIKCGIYKHFKDKDYKVFSTAIDSDGILYVLYQQLYGNNAFWIRPYNDFFATVSKEPKTKRFTFKKRLDCENLCIELGHTMQEKPFLLKHTETEETYLIFSIPDNFSEPIKICSVKNIEDFQSAYLTDFQIARRMGFHLYLFNGKRYITPSPVEIKDSLKLTVSGETDTKEEIENHLDNPCSLDLRIADNFFCKTTRKKIDLLSMLRYHNKSADLWKEIKPKTDGETRQIVIHPGETIITHTFEKITLPSDCAGKIEIKSTYARLSLSVTTSDFCNPGWSGYFPLVIHNYGKHRIVLHPKEKMLQLMLLPTRAPIISEYSSNATFMDDDGTPYRFWQSRAAKQFRKSHGLNEITDFYEKVLKALNSNNCDDVEGCKKRFADTFLLFCEKELQKSKYNNKNNANKVKELWKCYKKSEQRKQRLSKFRVSSLFLSLLPTIIPLLVDLIIDGTISFNFWLIGCGVLSALSIIASLFWILKPPKVYCTFEKLEYEKISQESSKA